MSTEKEIKASLGPLKSIPSITSNTNLSTTPVKITLATLYAGNNTRRVKIVNGHASNVMAWTIVATGATAPTITADYNSSTGGIPILPQSVEYVNIACGYDLYLCASASGTSYAVVVFTE